MTTDFRVLCAELSDALRNAIRVVYHEDGTQHISTAMPILRRARAVLADEPAVPEGREPASVTGQPSDGEVAELIGKLVEVVPALAEMDWDQHAQRILRAVELLQRLSPPQPVPVSERLPGPGEMTEDGEVWVGDPGHDYPIADSGDYDWEPHKWIMRPISRFDAKYGRRWLPAHALPVPGQEVEG